MNTIQKNKIRSTLTLELNSCFSNVSQHYALYGDEEDRKFLELLIGSIKNCLEPKVQPEPRFCH